MFSWSALIFLISSVYAGDSKSSGLSQFWTDDFKVFDQVYGKTSDKDLYGATLPPSVTYGLDLIKPINIEALEKKERYSTKGKSILDLNYEPYDFGDRYAKLFAKSLYTEKVKPSSALQFISFSDFKPISEATDPETYNYLKHLEKMNDSKSGLSKKIKNSSKYHHVDSDAEADEAYRSIQDILDAHEANKGSGLNEHDAEVNSKSKDNKYITEVDNEPIRYSRNRNRSKVRLLNGNSIKSRCVSSRCRSPSIRPTYHSLPYIRKIKHYRYTKR